MVVLSRLSQLSPGKWSEYGAVQVDIEIDNTVQSVNNMACLKPEVYQLVLGSGIQMPEDDWNLKIQNKVSKPGDQLKGERRGKSVSA